MTETYNQTPIRGSCLCGQVSYEFTAVVGDIVMCHCKSCRKASGSAAGINAAVAAEDFKLHDPKKLIKQFESSLGKVRHFCSHCGSPLFNAVGENPQFLRVRLGSVDSDLHQTPVAHIFMKDKADWDQPESIKLSFEAWPDLTKVKIAGAKTPG